MEGMASAVVEGVKEEGEPTMVVVVSVEVVKGEVEVNNYTCNCMTK